MTQTTYRIITLSGRGLLTGTDADGYDTRLAAEAMAEAEHDGEYRIEEVVRPARPCCPLAFAGHADTCRERAAYLRDYAAAAGQ